MSAQIKAPPASSTPTKPPPITLGREPRAAAVLQVLATEHWSLLSTRALSWNESFNRAGMFLSTLSASIIALALLAQASSFRAEFPWFALVILSGVLVIGLATFARLVDVNGEDVLWVRGMNRLRSAYVAIVPELAPFLITSPVDDGSGVLRTMGVRVDTRPLYHHVIATTPAVVGAIDAIVAGSLVACLAVLAGLPLGWATALAIALASASALVLVRWQARAFPLASHQGEEWGGLRGSNP